LRGPKPRKVAVSGDTEGAVDPLSKRDRAGCSRGCRFKWPAIGGHRGAWGLAGPMAIRDRFHTDARSRCCAGARHVALITADLFAVLLGQRDIEHQDEHRKDFSTCDYGLWVAGRHRRTAA
jgi:hypothetical protein